MIIGTHTLPISNLVGNEVPGGQRHLRRRRGIRCDDDDVEAPLPAGRSSRVPTVLLRDGDDDDWSENGSGGP